MKASRAHIHDSLVNRNFIIFLYDAPTSPGSRTLVEGDDQNCDDVAWDLI